MNKNILIAMCLSVLLIGNALEAMKSSHEKGESLLDAINHKHWSVVKIIINEPYAPINYRDLYGETPLIAAVRSKAPREIIRMLINAGADFSYIGGTNHKSALGYAVEERNKEMCMILIDAILEPTKEQKDKIVAFLAQKKRGGLKEAPMPSDMIRALGKQMFAQFREQNKPKVITEINKIKDNEALKLELLAYVDEKTK